MMSAVQTKSSNTTERRNYMEKKMFRVFAESVTDSYVDVEAYDEQEARDIAEDMDGGDFIICDNAGDWRITTVDPL